MKLLDTVKYKMVDFHGIILPIPTHCVWVAANEGGLVHAFVSMPHTEDGLWENPPHGYGELVAHVYLDGMDYQSTLLYCGDRDDGGK